MRAPIQERWEVSVRGIVQGVGFRPFVYALARRHGLAGLVRNDAEGVHVEVEGDAERLDLFLRAIEEEAPPLAVVEAVSCRPLTALGEQDFRIEVSQEGVQRRALVSPDVATCEDCLWEVFDPADRRYRYPFTNCTNCGPRFTIVRDLPYDRPLTTMAAFQMCARCHVEYEDPSDRRFHAQPNACPLCGPRVKLLDRFGHELHGKPDDPILRVARMLRAEGHEVHTPSLTGCGDRAHLLSGAINLSTHIQDVVNLFDYEGIERAVLAGHSYGGMVITGVADRIDERISALVYLDAFLPEPGQSLFDINRPENTARFIQMAGTCGGLAVPPPPVSYWNLNAADAPRFEKLTGPHPIGCFVERLALTGAYSNVKKKIYVQATELGRPSPFQPFYERCSSDPAWETHRLACGHHVMMDMPAETAAILRGAAG
jgi:acylphosphatase/pimeloyl-ACP methyl ester carboxylesterase